MKKVLFTLVSVLFVASSASAMPFVLNPDAALGTAYGTTSQIDTLEGQVDTTSNDPGAPGGAFSDKGDVAVGVLWYEGSSLGPSTSASYGDWSLVGGWTDLTGSSLDGFSGYVYNPGATLTLYARTGVASLGLNPGVEDDSGFTGVEVAKLSLVDAAIGGDAGLGVSLDFNFKFTEINEGAGAGFWLAADGVTPLSLADLGPGETLRLSVDANTSMFNPMYDPQKQETNIYARHHFTAGVGVVPEPATMALFGTGLLGLAGAFRKKRA